MELLIVIVIGSIVTGGIIMLWFNISRSSAMTTSHAEARDFARDGIARLSREIRDAEALPGKQAVQEAKANSIAFTTTFNVSGNEFDTTKPRLVRYVYDDVAGCLYRQTYADGVTDLDSYARRDIVIPHMLNDGAGLFSYTYVPSDGGTPLPPAPEVTDPGNLSRILLVRIHVIVDLDPGKAPNGMDITTEVQLRNQRILD
jgi:hypothetical protein